MIDLMDGFFISPTVKFTLRHRSCGLREGPGAAVCIDYRCSCCLTLAPKKVVLMHKLWEFNK